MKLSPAVLALVAMQVLLTATGNAQTMNPGHLSQMPSAVRVRAEIKGTDAMDTAARHMGAFWQLQRMIEELSGPRSARDQLTPDEKRLIGEYRAGYFAAQKPFEHLQTSPSHPDKPKWFKMHSFYETDDAFFDDVLRRLCAPEFRAAYYQATGRRATSSTPPPARVATPSAPPTATAEDHNARGDRHLKAKEYAQAVAAYKEAIRLKPSLRNSQLGLGLSHYYLKEFPAASTAFEASARLPSSTFVDHYWLGMSHKQIAEGIPIRNDVVSGIEMAERYEKARAAFDKAVSLKPDDAESQFELGYTSYITGQQENAIKAFNAAIRLNPNDVDAYLWAGHAHLAIGKREDAVQVYRKLLTLDKAKAQQLSASINKSK